MNYLITGGAGFIGSHLADALLAQGHRVTALDDLSTGRRENLQQALDSKSFELVVGNIEQEETMDRLARLRKGEQREALVAEYLGLDVAAEDVETEKDLAAEVQAIMSAEEEE